MNIEDYKKLFVPVEERLPEEDGNMIFVLRKDCVEFAYTRVGYFIDVDLGVRMNYVTHWLDLSRLTTKDAAEELAKCTYKCGYNYWQEDSPAVTLDEAIDKYKNIL